MLYRPGAVAATPTGLADALALMGGFCFALTNTLLRRWRDTPQTARATAMFLGGASTSSALALLIGADAMPQAPLGSWLPWLLALTAAFLCGNLALQYGAARLPAQTTSLIMLSEVVFASVSAVLLACRRHAQAHGKTLHVVQWPAKLQSLAQVYGVLEWLSTPQDKSVAHAAASAV